MILAFSVDEKKKKFSTKRYTRYNGLTRLDENEREVYKLFFVPLLNFTFKFLFFFFQNKLEKNKRNFAPEIFFSTLSTES